MFGLKPKPPPPTPPQSSATAAGAAAEARRKHIAALQGEPLFRVSEIQKDAYEVSFSSLDSFTSPGSQLPPNLQLVLTLPPNFPDSPPLISLKSPGFPVSHPWLDSATMRVVGHPHLTKEWNGRDTQTWTLGRIVADIVRELQLNPPKPLSGSAADFSDPRTFGRASTPNGFVSGTPPGQSYLRNALPPEYPGPSSSPSSLSSRFGPGSLPRDSSDGFGSVRFHSETPGSPQRTSSWSAYANPATDYQPAPSSSLGSSFGRSGSPMGRSAALPEIDVPAVDRMSEAEINELLSDNEAFQDFFLGLEQVRSMTSVSKELQQSNEQLARKTLEREEELRILQTELRGKIAAMNEARTTLEGKERERDKLLSKFSPAAIVAQLSALAQQSDARSEAIAESFLTGSHTTEDFLREFREERKLYHLRNAKVERARATLANR